MGSVKSGELFKRGATSWDDSINIKGITINSPTYKKSDGDSSTT
jgi:hypothetical protein